MADNGRFRNLISNSEIASIVETVFTNVSWSLSWFSAGEDTSANPVSTFKDDNLNTMTLQNRSGTETGDARSDYDDSILLACAADDIVGGGIVGKWDGTRVLGDNIRKTAVQLFLHLPR